MTEASNPQDEGQPAETTEAKAPPIQGGSLNSVRNFPQGLRDLLGMRVRVIHPGEMITMDFNARRVNIHVGVDGNIGDITIG